VTDGGGVRETGRGVNKKIRKVSVAGENGSAVARAEAIRAHLEAKFGIDRVAVVTQALEEGQTPPNEELELIGFARHLILLEEVIQNAR
jgi:hypothetical protein